MTGKHRTARRILALVLCAVLVLPMGSTGLAGILSSEMWNSIVPTAYAANASNASTLSSAISGASASGTTTIQLTGNITDLSNSLPEIDDNIILDLNGYSITYSYTDTQQSKDSSNIQLPTANAGSAVNTDVLSNAIFSVATNGTLKIINSSSTASQIYFYTEFNLKVDNQ